MEGVYLIHTRECISTNKFIYKFGRSLNISNRIKQYPQNSNVEFMMSCNNSIFCEKEILKLLRAKFIQASLYGSEYFEGDKHLMIEIIVNYINGKHNIVEGKKKIDNKNCNKKIKDAKEVEKKVSNVDNVNTIQTLLENNTEIKSNEYISDRKCPKCNHVFKFPSKLKHHLKTAYHCMNNNINSINNTDLNTNILLNLTSLQIPIRIQPILQEDINNINNNDNNLEDRTCIKCNTVFTYPSVLKTHMKTSSRCKIINEEKKEDKVEDKVEVKKEIKKEIKDNNENINTLQSLLEDNTEINSIDNIILNKPEIKCNICKITFTRINSLKRHNLDSKCSIIQASMKSENKFILDKLKLLYKNNINEILNNNV